MAETLVKGVRMQRRAATLAIAAILVGGAMSKGLWAQQEAHQTKRSGVIDIVGVRAPTNGATAAL